MRGIALQYLVYSLWCSDLEKFFTLWCSDLEEIILTSDTFQTSLSFKMPATLSTQGGHKHQLQLPRMVWNLKKHGLDRAPAGG